MKLSYSIFFGFIVLFGGCDFGKIESGEPFPWAQLRSTAEFKLEIVQADSVYVDGNYLFPSEAAMILDVVPGSSFNAGPGEGSVDVRGYLTEGSVYGRNLVSINARSLNEGLVTSSGSCSYETDFCFFPNESSRSIRLPTEPVLGQLVSANGTVYRVEWLAKEVTVPAGSFETFALIDQHGRRREVWNWHEGLIQLDILLDSITMASFVRTKNIRTKP